MYSNHNIKTPYKKLPSLYHMRKFYAHLSSLRHDPVLEAEYHLMYFIGTASQDTSIETYIAVLLNEIRGKCE